jgi:hypothetical protein
MAFIKHYREVQYRVPDPVRPGHTVFDRRMDSSKTHAISHNGKEYEADPDGWFDVPDEVAAYFLTRPGWCSPEMVDEEVVAGRIRADAADQQPSTREKLESKAAPRKPRAPRRKKSKAESSAS